ncbi:MAG: hypothetical protein ACM3O3_03285 [Syntrophothermus sp.]
MKLLLLFIAINNFAIAQEGPWIYSSKFEIAANERCTISLYNKDSTMSFVLFDNILEKAQEIVFITQSKYHSEKDKYPNAIVLPFPIIENGLYYLKYQSGDKIKIEKIFFLI